MKALIVNSSAQGQAFGASGANGRKETPTGHRVFTVAQVKAGATRGYTFEHLELAPGVILSDDLQRELAPAFLPLPPLVSPMTDTERDALIEGFKSARGDAVVFLPPDPRDKIVESVIRLARASVLNTIVLILLAVCVFLQVVTR